MTTKRTRRPNFPEDFRRDAVALVTEQGYSQAEASGKGLSKDEREELKQLRRENRELKMEKDILEKASAYVCHEHGLQYVVLNK